MKESIIYFSVRVIGVFVRCLPGGVAAWIGKRIGMFAYYFDIKHKSRAYGNLKIAFAHAKSPDEIKRMTKKLFRNYGQNLIELFRMPLLTPDKFEQVVTVEGKENVTDALKLGKGVIMLAMHFGSWELASLSCVRLGFPYKVFVKPQRKYSRLDDLLNSYRAGDGSGVLERGSGTRDFIRSLKRNEVIGMVADQGGRDGVLVPFFGRPAAMSVGALRMGLKMGVPICFSVIYRENGHKHKMIIHKPFDLEKTGDLNADLVTNLKKVMQVMEDYIHKYPEEYMWFYKIWKYSNEAHITILHEGKTGHLRQSQAVAKMVEKALAERKIAAKTDVVHVEFKNRLAARTFSVISTLMHPIFYQGRLESLKYFLKDDSFQKITSLKTNFIISCGSSIAGVNNLFARDSNAKSIVILKPGLLGYNRFDMVVLPQHDRPALRRYKSCFAITHAAPNLISEEYLHEQSGALLNRYSHLKDNHRPKIGLLIGGNAKTVFISERQMKVLIWQIKEILKEVNMDILITTSRRTPGKIEYLLHKEFKKDPLCPLLILANQNNVPEAVGGILGLADIIVVSADSISMVSEAACSGKKTIVFLPETRAKVLKGGNKIIHFAEQLHEQGYVLLSRVNDAGRSIYDMAMNKIQPKTVNDNDTILETVRKVI